MNRLNRIFHNKQIKLFWFLRSFARYLTPKRLLQFRLDRVLAEAERRPDWEYICRRADYYNKLSPAPATPPREGLRPLGDHKFRRGVKTAYFFDTYEFTRWFSDRLLWNTVPGDVTTVPDVPSIVKSRPICGDNANSVLLNLDKVRHFIFLRDDIPFRKKSDKAIFRLAITRRPHRERFMRMYFGSECCDAGISTPRPEYPPEWTKPHISMYDHLNYKFILAIEGYDVATNLKWIMSSNSLAVMPVRPTRRGSWRARSSPVTTTSRSGPTIPTSKSGCATTSSIRTRPRRSSRMRTNTSRSSATAGAKRSFHCWSCRIISGAPGSADSRHFSFLSDSGRNFARLKDGFRRAVAGRGFQDRIFALPPVPRKRSVL